MVVSEYVPIMLAMVTAIHVLMLWCMMPALPLSHPIVQLVPVLALMLSTKSSYATDLFIDHLNCQVRAAYNILSQKVQTMLRMLRRRVKG